MPDKKRHDAERFYHCDCLEEGSEHDDRFYHCTCIDDGFGLDDEKD